MDQLSVIIIKYHESNTIINDCLESIGKQKNISLEIIFLDQSKDESCIQMINKLNNNSVHNFKYFNISDVSLSFARNHGIEIATNNYVAFIDPDAVADDFWAINIFNGFKDEENVGIVGGKILPTFLGNTSWYHKSSYVKEVYSLLDLGETANYVRKVIGANFALNLDLIGDERFNEDLGRVDGKLLGGEETEFCERLGRAKIRTKYVPNAIVYHQIPVSRLKLSWILRRFYYGGFSRAIRGGSPAPSSNSNKSNNLFLVFILLPYCIGFIKGELYKIKNIFT